MMNWLTLCLKAFTDHKNRLDRKNYCLYFCLYFICYLIYIFFLIFIFSMFTSVRESHLGSIIILSMFILPMIGMVLFYIPRLMIRRMNDCNISWCYIFIPLICLIVFIVISCLMQSRLCSNEFDVMSRKLTPIFITASISWLIFAFILAFKPGIKISNEFGLPLENTNKFKKMNIVIHSISTTVYLILISLMIYILYVSTFTNVCVDYYGGSGTVDM